MFKALAATSCVLVCCLGNPANAQTFDDVINNDVINDNSSTDYSGDNRFNTNSYNTTTTGSHFDYSEISNETLQHASVPSPVGPAAPDSVAVFTVYGQVDQVGPVAGFSISIPLTN